MSWKRFWKNYDRGARVDFAGTLLGLIFDWRTWLASFVGGGGMTFMWAAIAGRDPLDVYIYALISTACFVVIVAGAATLFQAIRGTRLAITFDPTPAGQGVADHRDKVHCFDGGPLVDGEMKYIRVNVRNRGRAPIEVAATVVDIKRMQQDGTFAHVPGYANDRRELDWAGGDYRKWATILRGQTERIGVIRTHSGCKYLQLAWDYAPGKTIYSVQEIFKPSGTHRITIEFRSKESVLQGYFIDVKWDGRWDSVTVVNHGPAEVQSA
jgi:hypothetical protein